MFAHLHVRSWHSFLAGGSSPEALVREAARLGIPALGLTDRHGVYGAVRFQKACRAEGIKSIIGAEVTVGDASLVLIARSSDGYSELCKLLTAAHLSSQDDPSTTIEFLSQHSRDLFCLTGGRDSLLSSYIIRRETRQANQWLSMLKEVFSDRLFVELSHQLRPGDSALNRGLHRLAADVRVPVVATGDVRYAIPDDYRRYDLMTCIRNGSRIFDPHRERPTNSEAFLRSESVLRRLIPYPEAIENTGSIAEACTVDLLRGHVIPPQAHLFRGVSSQSYLTELCSGRLREYYPPEKQGRALEQLQKELEVVCALELDEYFLVVREVVTAAREWGIRCAGRGSAANSIIAFLLGITGVDPIEHNLLFERFLHGGRKGTPDIDIDFDSERRQEVISWMEQRFGIEQTAMTANVITYQLRMALRDTAKALGYPAPIVDKMAQAVPHHRASNIREYRDSLAEVAGESPLFEVLLTMVESLHDCPRHLSLHSGGMLLSRTPLHQFTPIQVSSNGTKVAQFDKNDVEALGLIKLDVLGLRMLATLSEAVELARQHLQVDLDIDHIPLDDVRTFNLIRSGRTIGIFQIESQGQMHLLAQHQPESFDDLISEIALFRPGPLQAGMVNPFIRRRRGLEPRSYLHPDLEPILRDTYGVILFQEQVLDVAHRFAGMTLAEADHFRSLMSKFRDRVEMESMRERFVEGAMSRGVSQIDADLVFDQVANFVGYGFCRSHAAAFAKTVYQSAWMKCYYPHAFMAAIMQHRPGMYSLMTLEEEARRFGVPILLPSINHSDSRYGLEQNAKGRWAIRKPLSTIKGISTELVQAIVLERFNGEFRSIEDMYRRVSVPKDMLDALARSGAFDELAGSPRRALWESGVVVRRLSDRNRQAELSLFSMATISDEDIPDLPELSSMEQLSWDYATHQAARYHPMILLRRRLNDLEVRPIVTCSRFFRSPLRPPESPDPILAVGGLVVLRQMPPTAKGTMFITLEDETGYLQCVVSESTQKRLPVLLQASALIIRGKVQIMGNWRGIVVTEAWALDGIIGGYTGYPSAYGGTDLLVTQQEKHDGEQSVLSSDERPGIRPSIHASALENRAAPSHEDS